VQSVYRGLHKETGGKICFCNLEVTTGGKSSEPSPLGSLSLVLHTSGLARNLLKRVLMRFIIFRRPGKPCLVKYFKWLLK